MSARAWNDFTDWQTRLRQVLNTVWDPIGGCPPDEYDLYIPDLTEIMRSGAPDDELAEYLLWAENERMGMPGCDSPAGNDRRNRTVSALRALGPPS